MVPTLQERFENPNAGNVLGQEREQGSNRIKYYKFNEGSGEETP
jgi:hypothetical protein